VTRNNISCRLSTGIPSQCRECRRNKCGRCGRLVSSPDRPVWNNLLLRQRSVRLSTLLSLRASWPLPYDTGRGNSYKVGLSADPCRASNLRSSTPATRAFHGVAEDAGQTDRATIRRELAKLFIAVYSLSGPPKISKITVLTILRQTDEVQGNRETSGKRKLGLQAARHLARSRKTL